MGPVGPVMLGQGGQGGQGGGQGIGGGQQFIAGFWQRGSENTLPELRSVVLQLRFRLQPPLGYRIIFCHLFIGIDSAVGVYHYHAMRQVPAG